MISLQENIKKASAEVFSKPLSGNVSRDARFCGTTASMCGIEEALEKQDEGKMDQAIRLDLMLHGFMLQQSGIRLFTAEMRSAH